MPTPAPTGPFPSFGRALLVLCLMVVAGITAEFLVKLLVALGLGVDSPDLILGKELLAFLGTMVVLKEWSRRSWRSLLALEPVPAGTWLPLAIGGAGLFLLIGLVAGAAGSLFPDGEQRLLVLFQNTGFLRMAAAAPAMEEVLFRGVILGGFLARYGSRKAIILSSLLFGLAHFNVIQFFTAFTGGLFTGWVFAATRSLWPVLAIHAAHNAVCYAAGRLWSGPATPVPLPGPALVLFLALALLSAGSLMLERVWRRARPQV